MAAMHHLMLDSNQWIYLATDLLFAPLTSELSRLTVKGKLNVLVTPAIRVEFERNIEKTKRDAIKNLKRALYYATPLLPPSSPGATAHRQTPEQSIESQASQVAALLNSNAHTLCVQISESILRRASDKTISHEPPAHKDKRSSYVDALIYESFVAFVEAQIRLYPSHRFVFSTANAKDFEASHDRGKPHPSLNIFENTQVEYRPNLAEFVEYMTGTPLPPQTMARSEQVFSPRCERCGSTLRSVAIQNGRFGPVELVQCDKCQRQIFLGDPPDCGD